MCMMFLLSTGNQIVKGADRSNMLADAGPKIERRVTVRSGASAKEIQTLLNENRNGRYHLTMSIPSGTYQMNRTLYVWPNTSIYAAPDAKFVKQSGYGALVEDRITVDQGGYTANENITIEGGIWDSTPVMHAASGTETFRFIHCNGIYIRNLTVCNVPSGSHLIVFAGVKNAVVDNCRFFGYGVEGNGKGAPKEAIQLDTVHSIKEVPTNQKANVKWDDMPCENIEIRNSDFYRYSRGIGSHTAVAGRFHTNVKIINNKFHDLMDSAIRLYNYRNVEVSGNTIDNVVAGILVYTYMEAADGNAYFLPLDGRIVELPENYNINIENNIIKNIHMSGRNWGDGIRVIGSVKRPVAGVTILKNTVMSAGRYGVFATASPGIVIEQNTILKIKKRGILVERKSNNAKIIKNRITTKKEDAISVYGSQEVLVEENVVSAKGNGIRVALQSPIATVRKNTIKSAGQNGIWISSGCRQAVVDKNVVKKYAANGEYYGIYVYQAKGISKKRRTQITENVIVGKGKRKIKHGIKISKSKYVFCSRNKIKSAAGNGIYAYKSPKCVIRNNRITFPKRYGILICKSVGAAVKGNAIKGISKKNKIIKW